jgi:hypothetical protein
MQRLEELVKFLTDKREQMLTPDQSVGMRTALDLPKLKATGHPILIAQTDFLGKNGNAKAASQ